MQTNVLNFGVEQRGNHHPCDVSVYNTMYDMYYNVGFSILACWMTVCLYVYIYNI